MPGPPGARPGSPLLKQRGAAVEQEEVGEGDVRPGLDRLPGPLGQQPGGDQPLHGLVQRIVVPLGVTAGVLRAGRGGQRVQHRGHHRGALRREVAGQHPGAVERGLQLDRPVPERLIPVLARVLRQRPGVDLPGQRGQVPQVRARPGRGEQDRVRGRAAVPGQLVRPLADGPGERLRDLPSGQRPRDLGMRGRPPGPRGVRHRSALGDPGSVDQPRRRAVIRVRGITLPGGERGQDRGPRRGAHRGGLLEHLQAPGLGLRRHRGGVRGGQVAQPRVHHVHRLARAGEGRDRIHLGPPPSGILAGRCRRCSCRGSPSPGRDARADRGDASRFSVRFYPMATTFSGT